MARVPAPLAAEILALHALEFLAGTEDGLTRFLAATGADAAALRQSAAEPEFLAAVMDFVLAHEDLAAAFCAAESLDAEGLMRARMKLPGA